MGCWEIWMGGKFVENFRRKFFGGNAIFDILEPPAFQTYSIHWVFEECFSCLCLRLHFVFDGSTDPTITDSDPHIQQQWIKQQWIQ